MTTGQPIRIPTDRNKYDNQFMENLKLQIKLNEDNLNANRLYTNTGQLPASTQMADTRTITEKLADVQGLKRSIIADLSPIAEPSFSSAIITGVLNSPLNINNSLFRYLAQNASVLAQQLSKKYKFGIAGDANDVSIIISFLEDAYNKTNSTFQSIKGYMNSNSNQGIGMRGNVLSANNTDGVIAELRDIEKRVDYFIRRSNDAGLGYGPILNPMFNIVRQILYFLPTSEQLGQIINNIENLPSGNSPVIFYNTLDILKQLPRPGSLQTLIDKIDKGFQKNDVRLMSTASSNFMELFSELLSPTNQAILNNFRRQYINDANAELRENNRVSQINEIGAINAERAARDQTLKAQRVYVINPNDDPVNVQGPGGMPAPPPAGPVLGPGIAPAAPVVPPQAYPLYLANEVNALTPAQIDQLYNDIPQARMRFPLTAAQRAMYGHPNMNQGQKRQLIIQTLQDAAGMGGNIYDPQAGIGNLGINGLGITKVKKGRGLSSDYREFGINKINHKKLDDGILTVRRQSNTNIPDMPSKRISRKLQKIIKHISGGGLPDYNELHNLDDSEKDYLHKLISKSNLSERLSVPTPSKDQEEKDFHQFEVMKGEIMSGNDSHELVKKFKILILKLSKQNILPKTEVNEILSDLLSLGY